MFYKYPSLVLLTFLAACSKSHEPMETPKSREDKEKLGFGSLAGPEGIVFGSDKITGRTVDSGGKVVNRYLWEASLNTLKFSPLVSSDGPGGVLVTDWYQASQAKDRIRIQVRIKSRELNSDALEVTVYKQAQKNGNWIDSGIDAVASRELENVILREARNIRTKQQ